LKVEIIAANSETITIAQYMLAQMWRIINRNTVCAAKIKDGKLTIGLIFDLSMIA
jgi:hypothetical protein